MYEERFSAWISIKLLLHRPVALLIFSINRRWQTWKISRFTALHEVPKGEECDATSV